MHFRESAFLLAAKLAILILFALDIFAVYLVSGFLCECLFPNKGVELWGLTSAILAKASGVLCYLYKSRRFKVLGVSNEA